MREWTDEVTHLVVQIDRQARRSQEPRLASFVVFLGNDTQAAEQHLKELAAHHGLARTPLTIYRDSAEKLTQVLGITPDMKLAVLTWRGGEVQSLHGFVQAHLTPAQHERVLADVRAVAP